MTTPVYHLRYAEPREFHSIEDLQRRSATSSDEYREEILAHPEAISISEGSLVERCARVAASDDKILGFCIVLPNANGTAELDGLFVEPELMGLGIGRGLVEDAISLAREKSIHRIEVTANLRAIGFYERLGFIADGQVATRSAPALRMHLDTGLSIAIPSELQTNRLRLFRMHFRDFEPFRKDSAAHAAKLNFHLLETFKSFLQPPSRDAAVAIEWNSFWMLDRETRTVIGACASRKYPDTTGAVEIAYGVAPEFQNKGVATEAVRALIQYSFCRPDVKAIIAFTLPEKSASTAVLTKCGFQQTGTAVDPR